MKRLLLILVCVMPVVSGIAQTLTGTVRERSTNDAIAYATVSLLQTDSSLVTGTITNESGDFQLQAANGKFILQVSYVGYQPIRMDVQLDKGKKALGDIYLKEETNTIAEVEVKADRPLIQRQMDKLVMNVSNTPLAVGFSGEEILKRAPGVVIDKDGNIKLNGKSVAVYIDGRPSYMSGEQLTGLLQGTDAAQIEKIELILHPSAKYDASGEGEAIINIKLKKNKSKGINGNLSGTYGGMYFKEPNKYFQSDRTSFSLNHRSEHTYTALAISQSYNSGGSKSTSSVQQPFATDTLRTLSESRSTRESQWYDARLSTDWYIDEKNTLGFIIKGSFWNSKSFSPAAYNPSLITYKDDTIQYLRTDGNRIGYSPSCNANVNYTHIFNDSLNRELTTEFTYNRSYSNNTSRNANKIYTHVDSLLRRVPNELNIATARQTDRYVVKADFQTAFWQTGLIECGAKWQLNHTRNAMQTDSVMPAYSSISHTSYDYSEHIAALYISVGKRFGEHWNTKIGLRGELTAYKGIYRREDEQQVVQHSPYFNLFPSAYVGYEPTDKWALSLTYDRSIWRPGVWYLNPFVEYSSAHSYEVGNPNLKPQFSNNIDMNIGWSRYVSVNFTFSHTTGVIEDRPEIMANGDIKNSPVNFGKEILLGASLSATEIPIVPKMVTDSQGKRKVDGAWLALTANVGLYDNIYSADATIDNTYGKRNSLSVYYYGSLNAYLPKDWQIGADIWGSTPAMGGYSMWGGGYQLGGSVKKQWPAYGLTLSLSVSDILRSSVYTGSSVGLKSGYSSSFTYTGYWQSVRVGLSWAFGQYQQHKNRNVGDSGDDDGKKSNNAAGM